MPSQRITLRLSDTLAVAPTQAPHTLHDCATTLLTHGVPAEVRERFDATAARLGWPLEEVVAAMLHGGVRHLDQCHDAQARPAG